MSIVRHPRSQAVALAGVLLASAAVAVPAAYAAPPGNDSIRAAVPIRAVPATFTVRTQQATSSPRDGKCVGGSSVWYRYRPATTRTLRAVTVGSNYHTQLAVFAGPRSARDLVACRSGYPAGVELEFTAGERYWIAVSRCCNPARKGRRAVLHLYEPVRFAVTTTIDDVYAGDVSGRLFVRGTTTCTNPAETYLSISASQRVGDGVAQGYNEGESVRCGPDGFTWEVPLWSQTGWAFRGGRASIDADTWASDAFRSARHAASGIHDVRVEDNARRRP